jgi:hypothetical protein
VSQTLTFVERDNQGTFHFMGEPSVSPGDSFYGNSPLYNAADTQRRGKVFFKCTTVTRSKRLSNGTLVISATFKGNKPPAGPVIGGTGAYEGASGAFRSVEGRRATAIRCTSTPDLTLQDPLGGRFLG